MTYTVSWLARDKVMYIQISPETTLTDYPDLDRQVMGLLNSATQPIILIIDLATAKPRQLPWDQIRTTQHYTIHKRLDQIMVIGNVEDRLLRLMMMVLFNLSSAGLRFYPTMDEVYIFLKLRSLDV